MVKSELTVKRETEKWSYRFIDTRKPLYRDCVRVNSHNTFSHEYRKFQICFDLKKIGLCFITECVFMNGKRADIVVPEKAVIVEVLCSETEKDCIEKTGMYPDGFEIIMVKAEEDYSGIDFF